MRAVISSATTTVRPLPPPVEAGQPLTALAPMQDVTGLEFMRVMDHYGPPDYFFTEYFRVHAASSLDKPILASITDHGTGRPVFAQLIGESLPDISRTIAGLCDYPVAGVDLNLGCPAPKVYRKHVGGGLLRDLEHVDAIFELMRREAPHRFTVKARVGFDSLEPLEGLLDLVNRHRPDLFSLHGRTVKEMYRGEVHYDLIRRAVEAVACPVLANGNISSARRAVDVVASTGAAGVMIGRSAIRNPWIFRQVRDHFAGRPVFQPTLEDVRDYVERLYRVMRRPESPERSHVNRMKKFLNFVGQGVDAEGRFLHEMRRARTESELFAICDRHLVDGGRCDERFPDEPFNGVVARPNHEGNPVKSKRTGSSRPARLPGQSSPFV